MSKLGKLLIAALLLAGFTAFAQDSSQPAPATPGPKRHPMAADRAAHRLMRLSKHLNLTDDQKEKLRPILQEEVQQMKGVQGDASTTPQQKRKQMREIRMSSRSQMAAILTPEQKEKLRSGRGRPEGRHRMGPGKANSGTANPGQSDPQ